jgi:hypothetical protein
MRQCGSSNRFALQHECRSSVAAIGWPRLLTSRELSAVPIARYFMVVGSALMVLLLIAGWSLPEPASLPDRPEIINRTIIRIRSAHKWPEKVVLDTSQPTIARAAVEEPPAAQSAWLPSDRAGNQSNLEAMAQLKADIQPAAVDQTLQVKRGVARTARSKRRIIHRLAGAEPGGGCCQFGRVDNRQAFSNAIPHRDAALSGPMDWPALTGRN